MAEKKKLTHLEYVQARATHNFLTRKRQQEEEERFRNEIAAGDFDPEDYIEEFASAAPADNGADDFDGDIDLEDGDDGDVDTADTTGKKGKK